MSRHFFFHLSYSAMSLVFHRALASSAIGHWSTCPVDFQQFSFFFFTSELYQVWRKSLASNIFRILCTTVIQISSFFIVLKKAIGFFESRCKCILCHSLYVCDLIYFHVVLCSSSRQILATPPSPQKHNWLFVPVTVQLTRGSTRRICPPAICLFLSCLYMYS